MEQAPGNSFLTTELEYKKIIPKISHYILKSARINMITTRSCNQLRCYIIKLYIYNIAQ